jgi:hypothetical protein
LNLLKNLKLAWDKSKSLPSLPPHLMELESKWFIKLLKGLGPISLVVILKYPGSFLLPLATIIFPFFTIYNIYISYHKWK